MLKCFRNRNCVSVAAGKQEQIYFGACVVRIQAFTQRGATRSCRAGQTVRHKGRIGSEGIGTILSDTSGRTGQSILWEKSCHQSGRSAGHWNATHFGQSVSVNGWHSFPLTPLARVHIAHQSKTRLNLKYIIVFRCQDISQRKEYVSLVENVREAGGEVKIFSSMHISGQRKWCASLVAVNRAKIPLFRFFAFHRIGTTEWHRCNFTLSHAGTGRWERGRCRRWWWFRQLIECLISFWFFSNLFDFAHCLHQMVRGGAHRFRNCIKCC